MTPERYEWPTFIEQLGIPLEKLPQIVHPGTPITTICRCAAETGLAVKHAGQAGMPTVALRRLLLAQ